MEQLKSLFQDWAGEPCLQCLAVGASGASARRYYRLSGPSRSCIGTIATDPLENRAFFAFTRHFLAKDIPVPQLYSISHDGIRYLQQDLGDTTLYSLLAEKKRQGSGFDTEILALYRQALADLAAIQQAGRDLDFSVAYPRPDFDRRSILWDLNYFKYNYLKLTQLPFDEERLENDFQAFADYLLLADSSFFLYRDFQSRNMMVHGHKLYYIDYQGGRRGAAQYDVASLLYSAKSDLPDALRSDLLRHYLDVRGISGSRRKEWTDLYYAFARLRILQALGAYGYRGLFQRKDYFLQSIPLALRNLQRLADDHPLPIPLPELSRIVKSFPSSPATSPDNTLPADRLTVTVQSFSFKQGLPTDPSGNGGGHIFDCRALPNPGRYAEYKTYTGKDRPVVDFLRTKPEVDAFLAHAHAIVAQSVSVYLDRHFSHLSVAFGCTGGQHRSVYCAEQTSQWLRQTFPDCHVVTVHREQDLPNK